MGFIRVRAASGPQHEFDVAEAEHAAFPDLYEVVDPVPVNEARPARIAADEPAQEPPPSPPKRRRK